MHRRFVNACCRSWPAKLDGRIHFLGRVPHPVLMALLQASWVHVYLSYPFVLGWSLLEAMACGCCIVGSRGMPVEEQSNTMLRDVWFRWMTQ